MQRTKFLQRKLLCVFFLSAMALQIDAQITLTPQLISTTGNFSKAGSLSLSASVGELAVETFFSSSHYLTQGFHQPGEEKLSFTSNAINSSCTDAANGYAEIQIKSGRGPFQCLWQPGGETSFEIHNLNPGLYSVTVTDVRGLSLSDTVRIKTENEGPCGLHFYSGLTPNGDNLNDLWIIDGIEQLPKNNVCIYNRWGDKIWEKNNYNNKEIVWNGNNSKNEALPQGTYFYVLSTQKNKYKGWVELTH